MKKKIYCLIVFSLFFIIPSLLNAQIKLFEFRSNYENIKINDDATTELQNEEQIVMNPKDTTNLVAVWRDFRLGYRQVAYGYSFDGGLTWNQDLFVETQYIWDSDPGLTVDTAGNFYAVILSYTGSTYEPNGLFVFKSTDGGATWGDPATVINGVPGVFEDKELIACDRSGGPYTNNLYVAWTRFYSTQILMCRSTDGGNSFVGPATISDSYGVQWPVPCVGPNSEVYVAWVHYSPGSIRFDRSTDGGQTFGSDITIQNASFISGYINGGIMVFSFPAMDVDITGGPYNGNIYVAYMDDAPGYTDTDIYFTRSTNNGNTWSQKIRINDDPLNNGCDQFHPWLTVAQDGSIIVVFLDRRLDSGNLFMDLYMTTSTNGGNTWSENERITTVSSDPTAGSKFTPLCQAANKFPIKIDQPLILAERAGLLGEYIGVTASSIDDIHPIWTDTRLGNQDVFTGVKIPPSVEEKISQQIHKEVIILYPEPFVKDVRIDFSLSERKNIEFSLYDICGREVTSGKLHTEHKRGSFVLNGKDLPQGTYFLHLKTTNFLKSFTLHKLR